MQSKVGVRTFCGVKGGRRRKKTSRNWINGTKRIHTFSVAYGRAQKTHTHNRSMNCFCIFYRMAHELILLLPLLNVTNCLIPCGETLIVYIWNISSIGTALGTLMRCIRMYILFVFNKSWWQHSDLIADLLIRSTWMSSQENQSRLDISEKKQHAHIPSSKIFQLSTSFQNRLICVNKSTFV